MKLLLIVLIPILLMESAFANPINAKVTAVGDGDTLTVVAQGQNTTIRLACIDAPEFQQTGGTEATQRLRQLIPIGSTVKIVPVARDQYNRVVAVVFDVMQELLS
jgi:micrococcal nuclease